MPKSTPVKRLRIAYEELRYRGLVDGYADLAESLGYKNPNQMSAILNGKLPITKLFILSMKEAYMISPNYITGESKGVFVEGYKPPKGLGEGALLKKIVALSGWSMDDMSEQIGLTRKALYYHTHNESVPDHIKTAIAKVLKKRVKDLWIE